MGASGLVGGGLRVDALFSVRLGFVLFCAVALVVLVRKHREVLVCLRAFFFAKTSAVNLGLLRVVVFGLIFQAALTRPARWSAALEPEFLDLPRGWEWLAGIYPLTLHWVRPGERLLMLISALAVVGLFTRVTTVLASTLALWILGIPNFYFKIGHSMHVPVLCALVLACSPCGNGASVDAAIDRFNGTRAAERSVSYTVPIRFCWLLLGTCYLFPGLWKLWETGDLWLNGTKVRVDLFSKWAQLPDFVPLVRVDHSPAMLVIVGALTLLFETGFFFALFARQSRVLAGIAASLFHLGIGLSMDIWFSVGFPLIVLLDLPELWTVRPFSWLAPRGMLLWRWLVVRLPERFSGLKEATDSAKPPPPPAASFVVGGLLLLAMVVAGLGPVDSWPIAVYPRFSDRTLAPPRMSYALAFMAESPGGKPRPLFVDFQQWQDSAQVYRIVRALIEAKGRHDRAKLEKYVRLIARVVRENSQGMEPGTHLLIYRFNFHVDPQERSADLRERTLIADAAM